MKIYQVKGKVQVEFICASQMFNMKNVKAECFFVLQLYVCLFKVIKTT